MKNFNELHLKYVDDLALLESIPLSTQLTRVPLDAPQPFSYHNRTGHQLLPKESRVFQKLKETEEYAKQNKMKINYKKTKLMVFNPSKTRDFHPKFVLNGHELELVEETKLLGLTIRSDLSWTSNTHSMVKRASKKLWCLRRLKNYGAKTEDLLDVYFKQVRCLLEYAVAVWEPSLTAEDSIKIERVQKCALAIILGQNFKSYKSALLQLNMETLAERRTRLCEKFSRKAQRHPKFSKWFKPNTRLSVTRSKKSRFCEVYFRTERFKKSPICYLTRLLNSQ